MKSFTVDELISELQNLAKSASRGGATKVCIDDIEGNLGAYGPLETLEVVYDCETDHITIFCNQFEH